MCVCVQVDKSKSREMQSVGKDNRPTYPEVFFVGGLWRQRSYYCCMIIVFLCRYRVSIVCWIECRLPKEKEKVVFKGSEGKCCVEWKDEDWRNGCLSIPISIGMKAKEKKN